MVSDAKMILANEGDKSAPSSSGPRSIHHYTSSPHAPAWTRPPYLGGPSLTPSRSLLHPSQVLYRQPQPPASYTANTHQHSATSLPMRLYHPSAQPSPPPPPRPDARWDQPWMLHPSYDGNMWRGPRQVPVSQPWSAPSSGSIQPLTPQQAPQPHKGPSPQAWQVPPSMHSVSPSVPTKAWSSPSASMSPSHATLSPSPMALSPSPTILSASPVNLSPSPVPFSPLVSEKWNTGTSSPSPQGTLERSLHSSESFHFNSSTDQSSSSESSDDNSRDEEIGHRRHLPSQFVGTLVPLKESDEELYLDPGSQKYIPLSQWIAKNGEEPRESLRKGASVGKVAGSTLLFNNGMRVSSLPHPQSSGNKTTDSLNSSSGWPVSDDGVNSPGNADAANGEYACAFADQVAMQNKLLQEASRQESLLSTGDTLLRTPDVTNTAGGSLEQRRPALDCHPGDFPSMLGSGVLDTLSPASPNPEPSGPSDLCDDYSLGHCDDVSACPPDEAISLLGSNASFTDSINEDSARAAMEEAQRQRGLAAKIDVLSHVITQREEDARQQLNSAQQTSDDERKQLETEIARLRAEAAQFKLQAEAEQRKREEERTEIISRIEALKAEAARSVDPQINEMLQKQEQMQQIIERMMQSSKLSEAGVEYIPHERHGITAVQFQILRCGAFLSKMSQALQGSILPYAVVRMGNNSLTSRLEHAIAINDLKAQQEISWNDLFTFPYLNERYLSVTLRIKENRVDQRQYDHLLGSARIDLEVYVVNPHMCGSQMVQLFDEKGQPTVAIEVGIQTTGEVTHCAFLAMKPKEMTPSDALLTQSLTSAFFESQPQAHGPLPKKMSDIQAGEAIDESRDPVTEHEAAQGLSLTKSSSLDSLEEILKVVDFRTLEIIAHPWRSLRIIIVGVRGIKLGSKTPDTQTSIKSTLIGPGQVHLPNKSLRTSVQPIRVTQLKKKRLFATATFNEECRFPYSMEKTIVFEFVNHSNRDDGGSSGFPSILGTCQLSLQRLLMTKLSWFKRRLAIEKQGGLKRVGHLDLILQFLPEPIMCCSISPSFAPIDTSFYSNATTSACLSEQFGIYEPVWAIDDVENRDAQLRLAEEAAENLPDPKSCQVTIECGRDLNNPSLVRQMEPFVKVKLGNFEARTSTAASSFPKWRLRNGQFAFALDRDWETQLLTFECYHASLTGRDKLVGITLLPLADLKPMPARYFSGEVTLLDKLCRIAGYLQLTVQLSS